MAALTPVAGIGHTAYYTAGRHVASVWPVGAPGRPEYAAVCTPCHARLSCWRTHDQAETAVQQHHRNQHGEKR